MKVSKRFTFEAAHSLPHLPKGHKCRNLHGHSYGVTLEYDGPIDPDYGWVIDYAEISRVWAPLFAQLDHSNLDSVLEVSTAENLAQWILPRVQLEGLCVTVRVRETVSTEVSVCQG